MTSSSLRTGTRPPRAEFNKLRYGSELDNTVFIITSDHGYFYGEHGLNPQRRLAYEETARIPMIIRYPALIEAGSREERMVLNIDLAPTVLDLAGQPGAETLQGRSLVPLLNGEVSEWRSNFLIEHHTDPPSYLGQATDSLADAPRQVSEFVRVRDMGYKAVRGKRYKYIQYVGLEHMDELYDLESDPYELENLIELEHAQPIIQEMREQLSRLLEETQ